MFQAPNYTQTPNDFFDSIAPTLKEGELRVLLVIMRQTFGWQKEWDRISLSQLERKTGMCRDKIVKSVRSLLEKGLILRKQTGENGFQKTWYSINVGHPPEDDAMPEDGGESIEENHQLSNISYQLPKATPPQVPKVTPPRCLKQPTKETLTKEKIFVSNACAYARTCAREEEVRTSEEEHQKLVQEHGIEKTQRLYRRLSEWKQDTPKSKWKKNDYRSILRWVILAEDKAEKEKNGVSEWKKTNTYPTRSKGYNATFLGNATQERISPPQGLIVDMLRK